MKTSDPNKQQHHTFGDSLAAERLKKEIDSGANYRSAVRMLNKYHAIVNDIARFQYGSRNYLLHLVRTDAIHHITQCNSDEIVKNLCRNVFTSTVRFLLKNESP